MFFPLRGNEDKVYSEETWHWWRTELTKLLKAFTDMGIVHGWWEGYSDENRWIVAVVRTEEEINKIKEFLRLCCQRFAQKKMYFDFHPVYFEEVS